MKALVLRLFCALFLSLSLSVYSEKDEFDDFLKGAQHMLEDIGSDPKVAIKASTGTDKVNRLNYSWSPKKIIITGNSTLINQELNEIRETLKTTNRFDLLKFVPKNSSKSKADLSKLLAAIQRQSRNEADNCFGFALWFHNVKNEFQSDSEIINYVNKSSSKLRASDYRPGAITFYRDRGENLNLSHAYIKLSRNLSLEKRGGGSVLIRTQNSTYNDYGSYLAAVPDGYDNNGPIHRFNAKNSILEEVYAKIPKAVLVYPEAVQNH